MEKPSSSLNLNLTEDVLKGSKVKIRRYPRLITNEKDVFEAASNEWEELFKKTR